MVVDQAYVRESIVNPQAKVVAGYQPIMPTFQGLVTEEQLLQLIAYVQSLSQRVRHPRFVGPTHGVDDAGAPRRSRRSSGDQLPE